MKNKLFIVGGVLLFILITGGIIPFCQALGALSQGFWAAFPISAEMAVDDYFSSAYFWTGVVMLIASAFGFWFGKKGGKILYSIISVVIFIISLISIGLNLIN